jgi:quercetin dioxygenase-like cupin family protein
MLFRDRVVTLKNGEFIVVPRGAEHRLVAAPAAAVMPIKPAAIQRAGGVESELTVCESGRI